jgi:hypothetical protein
MPKMPAATQLAENLIGRNIFVNWPMMHEAKVRKMIGYLDPFPQRFV